MAQVDPNSSRPKKVEPRRNKNQLPTPQQIEQLIDSEWSKEASLAVDRWLEYCEQEGL